MIPGKVEKELVDHTNDLKKNHPELIHINQHGFRHENHNDKDSYKYEFGENRSYKEQKEDIKKGEEIMKVKFGKNFSKIFSPPYYRYNDDTIELIKELNYEGISTKNKISEDKMNMNINPCINPNLDPIKRYEPLEFYDETSLAKIINKIHKNNTYIGIVLHPHKLSEREYEKFKKIIYHIKNKGYSFTSMENLNKITNNSSV